MAYTKTYSDVLPRQGLVTRGVNSYPSSYTSTLTGTRSGQSVPKYRELIAKGLNASSPYSLDRKFLHKSSVGTVELTTVNRSPPMVQVTETVTGFRSAANYVISPLITSFNEVDSMALSKLYSKVNAEITHFSGLAAIAEATEVVHMFGNPATSIIELTNRHINRLFLQSRGIRAIRYSKKQWAKIVSELWLEYAFGLAPLIEDTKKAAEALARWEWEQTGEKPVPLKLVGRAMQEKATPGTFTATYPTGTSYTILSVNTRIKTQVRAQYCCGYSSFQTADYGTNGRMMELLGIKPEAMPAAVWEGVPWSWLVDYFSNVNEILNSLEASKIKPTWISKTLSSVTDNHVRHMFDKVATAARVANNTRNVVHSSDHLAKVEETIVRRMIVNRTVPTSLGLPTLYFELPQSAKKMTNMAAVLLSRKRSTPAIVLETNYRNMR